MQDSRLLIFIAVHSVSDRDYQSVYQYDFEISEYTSALALKVHTSDCVLYMCMFLFSAADRVQFGKPWYYNSI